MNDPVIERVAREDPARRAPASGRDQTRATRARVFAAIDQEQPAVRRSVRGRTGKLLAGGAAVAAVVVVAVVALIAAAHHPHRPAPFSHKGQHAVTGPAKPVGLYAAGVLDLGETESPEALLAYDQFLWVVTPTNAVKLNLHNGQTIARTSIPGSPVETGLTSGADSIWLASTGSSQLLRIDPTTDRLLAKIPVGEHQVSLLRSLGGGVAYADGRIWVTRVSNTSHGDVIAVDPATDQQAGAPITVGSGPDAVVAGFGSLWIDNTSITLGDNAPSHTFPAMSRVDPQTHHVSAEPFSGVPANGFGSIWIQTNAGDNNAAILRVDPATGRTLARIAVPRVDGVAFGGGRVWVICDQRSRASLTFQPIKDSAVLRQIDPQTNRLLGSPIHLPIRPISIVVSRGQLWIAGSGRLLHFQLINHQQ